MIRIQVNQNFVFFLFLLNFYLKGISGAVNGCNKGLIEYLINKDADRFDEGKMKKEKRKKIKNKKNRIENSM